jgi:hypothetical protein
VLYEVAADKAAPAANCDLLAFNIHTMLSTPMKSDRWTAPRMNC